ncbi:cation:proton antiporter [Furfurilactobacillus siliginis]|uniref:Na(+) H(+) antiporter n=1 Tax=Furfurilactobacillus siliginis TaxID=348151 RepID=A0A0R2L5X4_9LACO|nr:sodium:proton antiporter [Furfurilactobacillus siliginis]KRN97166.1 Na(+) H(+) antiporter [Furfurilactobacillus siliginis]GEK29515.1 hypothetical protein LSI01_18260 [Furfurilactobacillus siliginis]
MTLIFAIGLLIIAVIAAEIIYNQFSSIPLAFYQIAAGGLLSFITFYHHYQFDPKFFLFAIIAPIMFNDAQETSRKTLGRNIMDTLSLAILLVITTVVAVGFGVHFIYPALSLSLAFMLIAIVSPTDATAVTSITKNLQLPSGLMETLKNESLLNDASGIVAFDLALTALISGNFSAWDGTVTFLQTFFGGLLLGAILGWAVIALRLGLINWNIDNSSISVPIQLMTPFIIYLVAEELHVSGILAVVAAGLMHGLERDRLQLTSTKMQVVSTSVWGLLTNLLNGFVFVLLGVSLPTIVENLFARHQVSILILVGLALGIYALMIVIRFLWIRRFINLPFRKNPNQSALLLSLSGVHGTVTLAMAFSLPYTLRGAAFPMRNELIFIAAIIILMSLIVPLITIPFILPKQSSDSRENFTEAHHLMIDYAIAWMKNNIDESNPRHTVIETLYNEKGSQARPNRKEVSALFAGATQVEADAISEQLTSDNLSDMERHIYQKYLNMITSRNGNQSDRHKLKVRLKITLSRILHRKTYRKARQQGQKRVAEYQQAVSKTPKKITIEPDPSSIQPATSATTRLESISATPVQTQSASATDNDIAADSETTKVAADIGNALSRNDDTALPALIQTFSDNPQATWKLSRQLMLNIEQLGNDAVMQWLYNQDVSRDPAAINAVRDSYIKRAQHFRRNEDGQSEALNSLFLTAFQAEYQYIQDALSNERISAAMAKSLREQVSYDQMVYMQNES